MSNIRENTLSPTSTNPISQTERPLTPSLYYSDNAIASSSEEDLTTNASRSPPQPQSQQGLREASVLHLREDLFSTPSRLSNHNDKKNLGEINPKDTSTLESSPIPIIPGASTGTEQDHLSIPEFNKRPLTDTPVHSHDASPILSNNASTVVSTDVSPELQPSIINVLSETSIPSLKIGKRRGTAIDLPGVTNTLHSPSDTNRSNSFQSTAQHTGSKLVVVMVGLPASGKSYISNKLTRYMNWLQHETKIFNVGATRRRDSKTMGPACKPLPDPEKDKEREQLGEIRRVASDLGKKELKGSAPLKATTSHNANFFNPSNAQANEIREKWAMDTLDQLLDYLLSGSGTIGIFDATNSTRKRRKKILDKIRERSSDLKVLFLESICSDKVLVAKNVQLKLTGPDYKDMDPALALKDFTERLKNYEKAYEPISDEEGLAYVKMIDVGKKVVAYDIQGFLSSQVVYYLLNFNLSERQIWITRHGESEDNVNGKIGGDSSLTERGRKFSRALEKFMREERVKFWEAQLKKYQEQLSKGEIDQIPQDPNFNIWTSMLRRSISTAEPFSTSSDYDVKEVRMLNELCAGDYEGLTYEQIQSQHPDEFQTRIKDKLRYRYPGIGGESYLDVINRVRPIINEVERTTDHVLLITHRVVARVLLGYFMNLHRDAITSLDFPLHSVYLLEPKPYGVEWSLYEYDESRDKFEKVEKEDMHKRRVKEVEVSFKERRYSVVPTAPSVKKDGLGSNRGSTIGLLELGLVRGDGAVGKGPLESVRRARGPPQASQGPAHSLGGGSSGRVEIEKLTEKLNKLKR